MTRDDDDDDDDDGDPAPLAVPAALDGVRADRAVAALLDIGTNAARRLIEKGRVLVARDVAGAKKRALKKGDPLHSGDVVVVAGGGAWFVPSPSSVAVLYEDAGVVVVDKPAGMPCHPLVPGEGGTVVDALIARYPELARASESEREGGLVHRLDTGTSGCLAFARTREAWLALRDAFSVDAGNAAARDTASGGSDVEKRYLAIVAGRPRETTLRGGIAHDPSDPRRMIVNDKGGRAARTVVAVVPQARSSDASQGALVEARLVGPGRRHQIRAHLAAAGCPLVGDALYGGEAAGEWPLLHAWILGLPGKPRIRAKVPSLFAKACAERGLTLPEGAI